MTHPRWIVPLEPDDPSPVLLIDVVDGLRISVRMRGDEQTGLPALTSLAAVQLGQALLDASAYVGQLEAKRRDREARRKR